MRRRIACWFAGHDWNPRPDIVANVWIGGGVYRVCRRCPKRVRVLP